jgi:hypothetical protein
MHKLGLKNPLYVILLVLCTVLGSYVVMWLTGTSLERAQELQWFFSANDLVPQHSTSLSSFPFGPPAPFGLWVSAWQGNVFREAVVTCIPRIVALVIGDFLLKDLWLFLHRHHKPSGLRATDTPSPSPIPTILHRCPITSPIRIFQV